MTISVKKSKYFNDFDGEEYLIDLDRKMEEYEKNDLICFVNPFLELPLRLNIAINTAGKIKFRSWEWVPNKSANTYLHTFKKPEEFTATEQQIETVNGLWSGRIKFDGLKIAVGATVQEIAPINVESEEEKLNKKIFLNLSSGRNNNE